MKISDGVEWGLHCAVLLAFIPAGATLSGSALAKFHGVSESYLLKHLKAMAKADLLESVPGPKGGYRLAKPPEEITVLDIVLAIEGSEPAFRCSEIRQRGPACLEAAAYRAPCHINATMLRAEAAWRDVLRSQTLAELVRSVGQTVDPRSVAKTGVWLEQNVRG